MRKGSGNVNTEEGRKKYKLLNNQLRRVTDKAKDNWWRDHCEELEQLDRKEEWTSYIRKCLN